MTDVTYELITDYNMILYFEEGTRGGISSILGDKYVDVDNKNYLTNSVISSSSENQEYLLYIDANNLYGHAMMQKLPIGEFSWITDENEIKVLEDKIKNNEITGDEDYGYCLKVDLTVPKTEHFENYPLAPESKIINYEQLSKYSQSLLSHTKKHHKSEKLILDFIDKKDYILHIKNLILYKNLGCKFKIKDAIKFKQEAWLKSYIEFNSNQRAQAQRMILKKTSSN